MNGLVKTTKFLFSPNIYKRTSKVNKNTEIVIPTIIAFARKMIFSKWKNHFIYIHDMAKGLANFNLCSIKKKIFISPGSDIVSGKLSI
jgi:hypothetical protein